jgi:ABC-2 type transport system ATP-binding protein
MANANLGWPVGRPNRERRRIMMLFDLKGVTKKYRAVTALDNLSVALPTGAVGLLGPNGAGKTTMIRTLLGLININEGEGHILGMDIRKDAIKIRQAVGFVPEDECLFPGLTGVEFVTYAGELAGMDRRDAMQRSHEVLDYAGLSEQRYRPVDSYSTGMKQKLKLASAIVHDPKLLIMDEPTNGLDPKGREEMLNLARDLSHEKQMSVLFSSHLLPDVEYVCDYVMVMGKGKLLAQGRIDELKARIESVYQVRVKTDAEEFAKALEAGGCRTEQAEDLLDVIMPDGTSAEVIWRTAAKTNTQIRYLRPRRSTLEEVFLKAVGD